MLLLPLPLGLIWWSSARSPCAAAELGHRRDEQRALFWWTEFSATAALLNMRACLSLKMDVIPVEQLRKAHGSSGPNKE